MITLYPQTMVIYNHKLNIGGFMKYTEGLKKSGIYMITNKLNNKKYIGQSKNIRQRWFDYVSKVNRKQAERPIEYALEKYDVNDFDFSIVDICDFDDLDTKEAYYINKFNTLVPNGYNRELGRKSMTIPRKYVKTKNRIKAVKDNKNRKKISKSVKALWQNEEYRENATVYNKQIKNNKDLAKKHGQKVKEGLTEEGKLRRGNAFKELWANEEYRKQRLAILNTPEHKEKLSKIQKNNWAKNPARKIKQSLRMSGATNPSAKKIKCVEVNKIYDSITIACIELTGTKKSVSNIIRAAKTNKKALGFHWRYM